MKPRSNPLLVLLATSCLLPLTATGATLYWDGDVATANNTSENTSATATTWLNGGNWDNGTTSTAKTSWTSGDVAIFGGNTGASVQTVTLASGISLGNGSVIGNTTGLYKISVTGTGYNQLGNPSGSFTINAGSTVSADAASNNAHNIGALTLNGGTLTSINGPGGAANDGGYGNWLLRGAVTVGGSTLSTISSTTLYINNAGASFTVADSVAGAGTDLLISSSVLSGGTAINKAGAGTMEMTGPIAGTSAINVNEGTLKLKGPNNKTTVYANGAISIASGATLTIDRSIPYGLGNVHTAAITNAGTLNWGKYESVSSAITLNGGTINVFGSGYGTYYQGAQLYNGNISTLANANSSVIQAGDAAGDNSIHLLAGTKNGNKGVLVTVADGTAADDLLISARLANESGDAGIAAGALTKEGPGTLTLTGTNSYTGATTINAGVLKLGAGGSIAGSSTIQVAAGAVLDASTAGFTLGAARTLAAGDTNPAGDVLGSLTSSGTIRPGGSGVIGTISGITNLTLGGTLDLDIDRGSNNSDSLAIAGSLTISPGMTVIINPTGTATSGIKTYTIASGITTLIDAANLPSIPGYVWDTTTDPTKLLLKVTAANLVWNGATDTSWNFATMNWHNGTGASAFADGDYVSFDDTATGSGPVTVNMIIDASPGSVTVNSTRDYTIQRDSSATFAGIIGTTSVVKSGTGLLNLLSDNIHSGGTVISGGILAFDNGTLGTTGTITMDGGMLRWFGSNTQNISARLAMVAGKTATFDTNGNDVAFTSSIGSSTNASLAKMGTGTLTLQASNTYTGITTINGGTLKVANSTALGTTASGTTVNSSATLDLNGTNISGEAITLVGGALTNTAASDGFPGAVTVSTTGTVHAANGWIQLNSTSGTGSLVFTAGAAKGTYGNYSGTWAHAGGTILESGGIDLYSATTVTGGPITINGGTLKSIAANRIGDNLAVTVNGGIWQLGGTDTIGSLAGSGGTVNLQGNTITTGDSSNTTYAGVITGTGGLVKQGSGTMTLSGANTYTGNTTVNAGMLDLSGSMKFVLTNTSANRITGTGGVNLNGSFVIDTTAVTATTGSWTLVDVATLTENFGSFSIAGAGWAESANVWTKTDGTNVWTFTEATGTLTLAQSAGFTSWIAGFGLDAADQDPGDDPDHDGVSNLVEYALAGRSPALSDGAAGTFTNGVLSFNKRADTSGLTYQIEESDDLNQNDPWTVATATQDANTISYSLFPATGIKKFARLVVTMTP